MDERLIRLPDVLKLVAVGKSTWWNWCRLGYAPQPIKFGKRVTCWRLSEVQAFIEGGARNE